MRTKQSTICQLKLYEWKSISNLLSKGYNISQAFMFIREDTNINYYFEQGYQLEDIIKMGKINQFYYHLLFFLKFQSYADAIDSAIEIRKFELDFQKKLIKKLSYPILILFISFLILYMFSDYIIPQLINQFEVKDSLFYIIVKFIKILTVLYKILFLVLFIAACMLYIWKNIKFLFLEKLLKYCRLGKEFVSFYLCNYLLHMIKKGCSTQKAFMFLVSIQGHNIIQHVAASIHNSLLRGNDIITAFKSTSWIDNQLLIAWKLGESTQDMSNALSDYLLRQEYTWDRKIKKLVIIMQVHSYGMVALIVVCIYKIMLIPLQILETI